MPANPEPPPLPPAAPPVPGWPAWPGWQDALALQQVKDGENLRMLSIFHYVVGGFSILFSSLFIVHIVFGIMMLRNPRFLETLVPSVPPAVSTPAAPPGTPAPFSPYATPTPAPRPGHRPYRQPEFPPIFGYFAIGMGSFALLFGWTTGALTIYSGRCLARRSRRMFSMVLAGINCLHVPFGMVLGVFTLIVLQRPTVLALYAPGEQR